MKNKIQIDVDTERTPSLTIGHPVEFNPTNPEEAKELIVNDISCVFEAFRQLITLADQSGYGKKADYIKTATDELKKMLE